MKTEGAMSPRRKIAFGVAGAVVLATAVYFAMPQKGCIELPPVASAGQSAGETLQPSISSDGKKRSRSEQDRIFHQLAKDPEVKQAEKSFTQALSRIEKENAEIYAKRELSFGTFWAVRLTPPTPAQIGMASDAFSKTLAQFSEAKRALVREWLQFTFDERMSFRSKIRILRVVKLNGKEDYSISYSDVESTDDYIPDERGGMKGAERSTIINSTVWRDEYPYIGELVEKRD
jgi:hypothetical protein